MTSSAAGRGMIIGGGIAGLACAIALGREGIRTDVFEAAPRLEAAGAGIWMAPNAMQVFEHLGIDAEIRRAGCELDAVAVCDADLRPIVVTPLDSIHARFGHSIVSLRRSALQAVLVRHVPDASLHVGRRVVRVEIDGRAVRATFDDGSELRADFLIGADGIHSAVRRSVFGEMPLRYAGQTCWRAVVPFSLGAQFRGATTEAWGTRVRFGFADVGRDAVYWFAVSSAPAGADLSGDRARDELLRAFGHFAAPVPSLIRATDSASIVQTDLYDLPPRRPWSSGPVCLAGDAAHPMMPNLGQGGAQAVEDAFVLARAMAAANDPASAFAAFEAARFAKVRGIVNASYRLGTFIHAGWPRLRNLLFRAAPRGVAERRMARIFTLDPPRA